MSLYKSIRILPFIDQTWQSLIRSKVLPSTDKLCHGSRVCSTSSSQDSTYQPVGISKAMQAYMERAKENEKFMTEQIAQYEIGKRHLANMMGENPETFTQEDVDNAIAYLLPSGLHDPRARPQMKHPYIIYPKQKTAEFDQSGRPYHSLFYTGKPSYYKIVQEIAVKASYFDQSTVPGLRKEDTVRTLSMSTWIDKDKLEKILLEKLTDDMYEFFIRSMERLIQHPNVNLESELSYFMEYRRHVKSETTLVVPPLMYTDTGIPYMMSSQRKKMAFADVTVYGRGTGKFNINGKDLLYFQNVENREQVLFPLQFTSMLGKLDVEASVSGGGTTGQSGSIRHSIAMCLRSFVDDEMRERMRIAGLLTRDLRQRERYRPGRPGRRSQYTWKPR